MSFISLDRYSGFQLWRVILQGLTALTCNIIALKLLKALSHCPVVILYIVIIKLLIRAA